MQLSNILSRIDDIESNQPTIKQYVVESAFRSNEMTKHWRKLDEGFFKGYTTYLQEVALQPDQIQDIFKQAQASADAGGDNSTMLGKIFDKIMPAKQASAFADSLPDANAGPVDGFEQKAQSSIESLQADPQTKQGLMGMIKAGMQKPESQQLILAAVGGGLSGLIGKVGPLLNMVPGGGTMAAAITGAVIAGGVAVATAKLQGKDWKTAFKGAIKPALMGGAAAVIGQMAASAMASAAGQVGDALSGGSDSAQSTAGSGSAPTKGASLGVGQELPDGEVISALDSSNPNAGVTIQRPDGSTYSVSRDTAQAMTGQQGISPQATGPVSGGASSDPMAGVSDTASNHPGNPADWAKGINPPPDWVKDTATGTYAPPTDTAAATSSGINRLTGNQFQAAPSWDQMTPDQQSATLAKQQQQTADAAQGTQNAKDYWANKPSYTRGLKENSASVILPAAMIYKTLHRASLQTIQMNEGIGSWLKTKASNMTKSVTADKLQSAWKAAGSPTDSDALAKVLQDSGVSPEIVNSVYKQLQIPAPGTVNTTDQLADIQAQIAKLDPASQKELIAYLQK